MITQGTSVCRVSRRVVMKKLIPFFFFMALMTGCQSTQRSELYGRQDQSIGLESKPVLAFIDAQFPKDSSAAQTLSEAYDYSLSELLLALQAYEIRFFETGTSTEGLLNSDFDNIIWSTVELAQSGELTLVSQALDGRSGTVLAEESIKTSNYMTLFSSAEETGLALAEEFYGEHIALAELEISGLENRDRYIFIDNVLREPKDGKINVTAGIHHVLVMGDRDSFSYFDEEVNLTEGETLELELSPYDKNQRIYLDRPIDINVGGDDREWNSLETYFDSSYKVELGQEIQEVYDGKIASNERNLYLQFQFANSLNFEDIWMNLYVLKPGLPTHFLEVGLGINSQGLHSVRYKDVRESFDIIDVTETPSTTRMEGRGNILEVALPLSILNFPLEQTLQMRAEFYSSGSPIGRIWARSVLMFTENPTSLLLWHNRYRIPGSDGAFNTFLVPEGFMDIDGSAEDWESIPSIWNQDELLVGSELRQVKTAQDQEMFYLLADCQEQWDRDLPLYMEFNSQGGVGGDRITLRLQGKKIYLMENDQEMRLDAQVAHGENFVELSISMVEESPLARGNYLNLSRIGQQIQENEGFSIMPYK